MAAIALLVKAALEMEPLTKQLGNCASSWTYIWKCTLGTKQILCIFYPNTSLNPMGLKKCKSDLAM